MPRAVGLLARFGRDGASRYAEVFAPRYGARTDQLSRASVDALAVHPDGDLALGITFETRLEAAGETFEAKASATCSSCARARGAGSGGRAS